MIWELKKLRKQVNKNVLSEKVGGILVLHTGVKSKETSFIRSNSPIFSTETAYALVEVC